MQLTSMENAEKVLTATEARNQFSDVFNEALYRGPVYVTKHSKSVAVVSAELVNRLIELEALLEAYEAQKALEEYDQAGGASLEEFKSELGIE